MTNWTPRFMEIADRIATWSKDPSTKVGCVIVDDDHIQLSGGFNGFPRGISDNERLANREIKLKLIVHAEANAVAAAARKGHSLIGSTAFLRHSSTMLSMRSIIDSSGNHYSCSSGWRSKIQMGRRLASST